MKKVRILIIVLLVILILGGGAFAGLYFMTDVFKSEKEMFYKYASQINLSEFINLESYNSYISRLEKESHSSDGIVGINLKLGEQNFNENISYSSYIDSVNKKGSSTIELNRNDKKLISMHYLRNQDLYGIKFDDIINQYVVVENNNLKEFATKLGIQDVSSIPDKIEKPEINQSINVEELKNIYNKYLNIVIQQIPEEKYLKLEKANISLEDKTVEAEGYEIKLNLTDIQPILIKIFETVKNDEQIFNLIKTTNLESEQEISFEEYQVTIQGLIEDLSQEISSAENKEVLDIIVYKQGKNTVKLYIKIAEETVISIERASKLSLKIDTDYMSMQISKTNNSEEQENWEGILISKANEQEDARININITRTGALTSQKVAFNANISAILTQDSDSEINLEFSNNVNFGNNIEIEEFNEENKVVINSYSGEQIQALINNLGAMIGEKIDLENGIIGYTMSLQSGMFETAKEAARRTEIEAQREAGIIENIE